MNVLQKLSMVTAGALVILEIVGTPQAAKALSLTNSGTPVVVNFTNFLGNGFGPGSVGNNGPVLSDGRLNTNDFAATGIGNGSVDFGGTAASGTSFGRGTSPGGVGNGGIYAFDVDSGSDVNRALGVQPSNNDFTPGTFTLRLINSTGSALSSLAVSYNIYVRNDTGRTNTLNFSYSSDNVNYTPVSPDFTSPGTSTGATSFAPTARSTNITGLNLANSAPFYLRYTGNDLGSGNQDGDELALDDISITPTAVPFEFSPGLGILLLGAWGAVAQFKRQVKNRKPLEVGLTSRDE